MDGWESRRKVSNLSGICLITKFYVAILPDISEFGESGLWWPVPAQ